MIAGLILKDNTEKESILSFLDDDGLTCEKVNTNDEIVELLDEKRPEIVAVDAGEEQGAAELTEDEMQLKEEGYSFTPNSHNKTQGRRLKALKKQVFQRTGAEGPDFIRFDPHITADELAIHDDDGLKSIGIQTENIRSAEEFDAALGAVTARFYQQNRFTEMGVIVPESLEDEE